MPRERRSLIAQSAPGAALGHKTRLGNATADNAPPTPPTPPPTPTPTPPLSSSAPPTQRSPPSPYSRTHLRMSQNLSFYLILGFVMLLELCTAAPPVRELHKLAEEQPEGRGARLLDHFNNRYPDGSYEFRFELDDGTARYERGYFAYIDEVKTLMVVGYYSYRMSDGRYITVFYNADQFGYRQNQSITPETYPNLPRSIEVPVFKETTTSQRQPQQPQQQFQQASITKSPTSFASSTSTYTSMSTSTPRAPTRRGRH
ncbi:hypothetical protein ACLKA7_007152 [Drosophila subpalustris]